MKDKEKNIDGKREKGREVERTETGEEKKAITIDKKYM